MERILQVKRLENKLIVLPCKKYVIKVRQQPLVCLVKQGLPGPSSDIITITLGQDLSLGDLVIPENGRFIKASYDNTLLRDTPISFFAFAMNDGAYGTSIQVKQFGIFTNPNWNLTTGSIYYLGLNGTISVDIPTQGLLLPVGSALNPTDLLVSFGTPIWLGD